MQEYNKQQYVDILTEQIRCRRARSLVSEEIGQHIEDQEQAYLREGMEAEAASREAVRQMGDPVETGLALDRIHRPKTDWRILALVGIITFLGLLVQYLIAGSMEVSWFSRQVICTEIGIAIMIAVCFADYTLIGKYPLALWCGFVSFLFIGISVSRGNTGLSFFPQVHGQLRIYPLLILLVPLYGGVLYRFRGSGRMGLLFCGGAAVTGLVLTYMTPNRTAMAELLVIFIAMLLLAVKRGWFRVRKGVGYLMVLAPAAAALFLLILGGGLLASRRGYALIRMDAALHPGKYGDSWGYMGTQLRNVLEQAALLGGSDARAAAGDFWNTGNISDLLYSYVIAAYGILAGVVLLLLLGGMIARIFSMAFRQKNQLGCMLGFGCACLFLTQTTVYVMYNMGYTFFSPMYLPFFSCAGTGTISLYLLIGLVLSVYRNTNLVKDPPPKRIPRYRLRLERIS
ncbi:MAG: permease prefix domain 1-containing protein [Lachnospiraceae bacterium]|nr:permease prefix domain 1-containing protein [Lachnospiraceae bacterium]MDY5540171.1 permease prefix domain 1-containing protein [Lachnospiraceae bacterium]